MSDNDDRRPACHHWWQSHGSEPDQIEIRVADSSLGKVYSTQVVALR